MANVVSKDAKGNITINGKPTFVFGVYDGPGTVGGDPNVVHDRFNAPNGQIKWNAYLNYTWGTNDNQIKIQPTLAQYGAYIICVAHVAGINWREDPATSALQYLASADFRRRFHQSDRALAVSLADEPRGQDIAWVEQWYRTYKAENPNLPFKLPLLQTALGDAPDWAARDTCDWLGADPYRIIGLEDYPLTVSSVPINPATGQPYPPSTYGYDNFLVGETAANLAYWCRLFNKVPYLVPPMNAQRGARLVNDNELWAHVIMGITEGIKAIIPWAYGLGVGALNKFPADQVARVKNTMRSIADLIAQLNDVILSDPQPTKLVFNSTTHASGDPKTWRLAALNDYLTLPPQQSSWDAPIIDSFTRQWYTAEKNALNAGQTKFTFVTVPWGDTVKGESFMLDQASTVRTRVYETADGTGYVFAYNHRPDAITATLRWYRPLAKVEELQEGRTLTIGADGVSWTDTFGGASSKRQGASRTAHIYKLTTGTPPPPPLPLQVFIDSPAEGATVREIVTVTTRHQNAPVGPVRHTLKVGGGQVSQQESAIGATTVSHSWDTKTVANGAHTLTAEALDSDNRLATATRQVTVANPSPLIVAITSPTPPGTEVSGTITVTATASGGSASPLDFSLYVDGVFQAIQSAAGSASFSVDTATMPNGSHTIEVRVTDGTITGSASITVSVLNAAPGGGTSGPPQEPPPPTTEPTEPGPLDPQDPGGPCAARRWKVSGTFNLQIEPLP